MTGSVLEKPNAEFTLPVRRPSRLFAKVVGFWRSVLMKTHAYVSYAESIAIVGTSRASNSSIRNLMVWHPTSVCPEHTGDGQAILRRHAKSAKTAPNG